MKHMLAKDDGFIAILARTAKEAVAEGYYGCSEHGGLPRRSLLRAVQGARKPAIIAEVKFVSPAEGKLGEGSRAARIAEDYERGGAVAVSVLAERQHFGGSLADVGEVKGNVGIPVVMKDVIVDRVQVDAAKRLGADAVLLIAEIFSGDFAEEPVDEMIAYAQSQGLEVLLEAHDAVGYEAALRSEADLVGINNRDLRTLAVSLDNSRALLRRFPKSKPVVCESGFRNAGDIAALGALGADAFLVGSVLMGSDDRVRKLRELRGE